MKKTSSFKCRLCDSQKYSEILNLGDMSLTGVFLKEGDKVPKSQLALFFCENCSLVQLSETYDKNEMFGNFYMYRSSITDTMKNHFNEIVDISKTWLEDLNGTNVLEIASNDGTLINMLNKYDLKTTAIDPSAEQYFYNYPDETDVYVDFFDKDFNNKFEIKSKFDLIISLAVLYDVDNPVSFAKTIYNNLDDNGIWITEQTSSLTLLDTNAYDSICHEHLTYLSYKTLNEICQLAGLRIIDAYKNDINGKSFVLVITKNANSHEPNIGNIKKYVDYENSYRPDSLKKWEMFEDFVINHKTDLKKIIEDLKIEGPVFGYGASTKGNVLLQYLGITKKDLPYILERDEKKYGLETPGSQIPIISEKEGKDNNPVGLIVFPWHFKKEIINREKEFLNNGGKLIFPLPTIEVVEY